MSKSNQPSPLNMTKEERRTLIHCIQAGREDAIDHFGEGEKERIESLWDKLGMNRLKEVQDE